VTDLWGRFTLFGRRTILALLCLTALPLGAQRPKVSLKDVVDGAASYLVDYQKQFAFVLADEEYTQQVLESIVPGPRRRTMTGESFLTFATANHAWISVRDVATVDGVAVPDREDLRALLQRGGVPRMEQQLVERNSRFNIGSIARNFNEPTLGLMVLERLPDDEFKFEIARIETAADATIVTLAFKEKGPSTLVHGMNHEPVYSTGEIVVEADTGRIRRSSLDLKYNGVVAHLGTDYAKVSSLDMWVPVRFQERYEQKHKDSREVIVCEARYTNHRRFEVNVRIR
jgi:hypothetical protein